MSYRNQSGIRKNAKPLGRGRGVNGKPKKRKRIEHGPEGETKGDHDRLLNLAIANPGNSIERTYTAAEVAELMSAYENGDWRHHIVGGGVMGGDEYSSQNEAPFPELLAQFFILSFCPPGGTVLDPFVGSGTTMAVAKRFGRESIGIDIRQSMIDLTRRRIRNETPMMFQH